MKFSAKHLAEFYYQLGTLVQAGLPIQQALVSMTSTSPRPMRSAVAALSAAVGGGVPLCEAMEQDQRHFSRFDCNAIRMTEHSGALDVGLLSLSHYHENRAAARRKLVSGSAYPMLLLVAGVFISNFPALFLGARNDKPYSLLDYARDTVGLLGLLVLIVWGAVRLVRWLCTIPGLNAALERVLMAVPVFGRLRFDYALSQWVSSIRLMLKAGIGIVPALETASRMVDSPLIAAAYQRAAPLIDNHMDVSAALASTGVFPDYLVQLWATGEKSGQMDEMLDRLGVFYEESWRTSLDHAVTWLPRIVYALVVVYMVSQIFSLFGSYLKVYNDLLNN